MSELWHPLHPYMAKIFIRIWPPITVNHIHHKLSETSELFWWYIYVIFRINDLLKIHARDSSNELMKLECKFRVTYCGLVTPYGAIELCHHWLRKRLGWPHQAIAWTDVDALPVKSGGINLRSEDTNQWNETKYALLKSHPDLTWTNGLKAS